MTVNKITDAPTQNELVNKVNEVIDGKQDTLTSSVNIKTINNESLLGSGNITIQTEGVVDQTYDSTSTNAQSGVAIAGANFVPNTATGTNSLSLAGGATASNYATNIGINSSCYSTTSSQSVAIGTNALAQGSSVVAVGRNAKGQAQGTIAIGQGTTSSAKNAIVIGNGATASGQNAIQLGTGTNSTANTFNVSYGSNSTYQMLDSSGKIPDDRLNTTIARTSQIPTVPTNVSAFTNDAGYTTNVGTVTSVNNVQPVNGNVTLSSEIFTATYNITSYSAIKTAQDAGKRICFVYDNQYTFEYYYAANSSFYFYFNYNGYYQSGSITSNNTWSIDNATQLADTNLSNLSSTGNNLVNTALNTRDNSTRLKFWTGTKAQYDAITNKDSNTLYNITDDTDVTLTLLNMLYPVGAIYIGTMATCPLATLGIGSWQLVASDRVLQGASSGNLAGTTKEAGLPNIEGTITFVGDNDTAGTNTLVSATADVTTDKYAQVTTSSTRYHTYQKTIAASLSNSIYGNSTTVQPPAYIVNIWERIS